MMISSPIPPVAAAAAAPPAATPTAPATPAATPTAPATPAAALADNAPVPAGAASGPDDAPPIPTREQAIRETMSMSAQDAAAAVASNFEALGKLTVGGGTKEGVEHAKLASMLLSNSSSMLQLAHLKASEHLRSLADELDMQMMGAATNLAFVGGQVALAGGAKQPIKVAELAAQPMAMTTAALTDVLAAITPTSAPASPPASAPDAAGGSDDAALSRAPEAAAPAAVDSAPAAPPAASTVPPTGLQHVTPGPGAGRGPNPA